MGGDRGNGAIPDVFSHLANLSLGSVPPLGFTTVTYFCAGLAHAVLPRLGVAGLQSFQEALGAGALR